LKRKKNISKKSAPGRVKDSKKVAAGKARAEQALKDAKGRYVSQTLAGEIQRIYLATKKINVADIKPDNKKKLTEVLRENKITGKQVAEFYKQNKEIFEDVILKGTIQGTSTNSNNTKKAIDKYTGQLFVDRGNGDIKKVTKAQLKLHIDRFKQAVSANLNAIDFSVNPLLTFDGKATYQIPRASDLYAYLKEYFGIKNLEELEEFTGAEINEAVNEFLQGLYKKPMIVLYLS
jgi:hypothetical protein